MLKFPPIKYDLPKILIYGRNLPNNYKEFIAFPTNKNKTGYGRMICRKIEEPLFSPQKSPLLLIDFLYSFGENKGFGSALVNFAKYYSKKNGANGNIGLKADVSFQPLRIPHVFYRKMGFGTLESQANKKLDKAIENHKDLTYKDLPCRLMFYPAPKVKQEKTTLFEKIKEYGKIIIDKIKLKLK